MRLPRVDRRHAPQGRSTCPVFSIGRVTEEERLDLARMRTSTAARRLYRKIVTVRGRLIGAHRGRRVSRARPSAGGGDALAPHRGRGRAWRFARDRPPLARAGAQGGVVALARRGDGVQLHRRHARRSSARAIAGGCTTVEALAARTGASTVCGSCRPLLAELAGGGPSAPERGWRWLLGSRRRRAARRPARAALARLIPYAATVQVPWQWDVLWRESFWKQVSGFTVLGLERARSSFLSLRKRIRASRSATSPCGASCTPCSARLRSPASPCTPAAGSART